MQKEKVIIVNEQDEIIWYKDRLTVLESDIYRVSWIMIVNSKWEYLLAQRSFNKNNNPGQWSMSAAWTIEKWETYDENIIHEIEEEIWIKNLKIEKLIKKEYIENIIFFYSFIKQN